MLMKLKVRLLGSLLILIALATISFVWQHFQAAALVAAEAEGGGTATAPPQPDDQVILRWVRDLDSDRFLDRELATERLILAGVAAVEPIVQALAANNLEVTTRGIHILQELALQSELSTSEAARDALEKVAAPRVTSAARRAAEALARLDLVRHERALEDLKLLGAVIGSRQSPLGFQIIEQLSIEIGEHWRGKPADLVRLSWLRSVDQVVISHGGVDDQALAIVAQMPDLPSLTIRRAPITARGIEPLRQMSSLRTLNVLYCPIGDDSVEILEAMTSLTRLRLYGTNLTSRGRDRLVQALRLAEIDVRRGAFLGIGCDPTQPGCFVSTVRPNTAAEQAGLQIGDLIERYEGKPVGSFEELTAAIAQNGPGDTVSLEIIRGDQSMTKKLKLGGWEQLE
jgi:hypothetical protein